MAKTYRIVNSLRVSLGDPHCYLGGDVREHSWQRKGGAANLNAEEAIAKLVHVKKIVTNPDMRNAFTVEEVT